MEAAGIQLATVLYGAKPDANAFRLKELAHLLRLPQHSLYFVMASLAASRNSVMAVSTISSPEPGRIVEFVTS